METLNLRKSFNVNKLETLLNRWRNITPHREKQLLTIELRFIMVSYDKDIQKKEGQDLEKKKRKKEKGQQKRKAEK